MIENIQTRTQRPKLYLPLALIAPKPAAMSSRLAPSELRQLVAAMID